MIGLQVKERACRICGSPAQEIGSKFSTFLNQEFFVYRCAACMFAFVGNPSEDYEMLYNEQYYAGKGADPLVSYECELADPESSLRQLEWDGILHLCSEVVSRHQCSKSESMMDDIEILDYGCGNGMLVQHLCKHGYHAEGWDTGWITEKAKQMGMPILESEPSGTKKYDVIIAIEVLEHIADPVVFLNKIRSLLKEGGLLILTTGNALPFWDALLQWGYVVPEVHVSYFTPKSLSLCMEQSGFLPKEHLYSSSWNSIIVYKVLKNLKFTKFTFVTKLLFCVLKPLGRVINKKYQVVAMPYGIAQAEGREDI